MNKVINDISNLLSIPKEEVENILNTAQNSYKRFPIKKKSGGVRQIFQPSSSLKALQYAFTTLYLNDLPQHNIAFGYKKGLKSPLRKNAEKHSKYDYSVRIDFKDFFSSIKLKDLLYYFKKYEINFNQYEIQALNKIIFPNNYISKGLPIGSPISPIISNIVMYELDEEIENIANNLTGEKSVTRYADDIVFSSNNYKDCKVFVSNINKLIKENKFPILSINKNKTMYMTNKRRRTVTGLIITPDRKVSIGRKKKKYIKKMIFDYINKNLDNQKINHLKGFLAFIIDVEPKFYNSLVMKYGKIVNEINKI